MGSDRSALWRLTARSVGAALLVVAGGVLVVTVDVGGAGRSASCGSGWDVVAGRSGWRQWWAQDLADPVPGARLLRTDKCVGAVNAHIVLAAVLAVAALAAFAVGAFVGSRRSPRAARGGTARRLRMFGAVVTSVGGLLTVAGLTGIALLTADPDAPLFLYVGRGTVLLLGLLLLLPAVLLVVLGRGMSLLAEQLGREGAVDEPP